ncbi:MAG: multicopper oxidase family protein [Paracoccaceae bacterium]|nr:multicopper oxidase family protein [Paracoccaceae bacterium]
MTKTGFSAGIWRRRDVLGLIGAAALGPVRPGMAATPRRLTARRATARLAPQDMPVTAVWGYDGTVPGPALRVPQGGRVTLDFVNELDQPSTVHWHGIRIDNAMDGVPGLTQAPVAPGETFRYDFTVPDAGTYWYHPHNRTSEQLAHGLYGALIVEEPEAPEADRDLPMLLDDWRLTDGAQIDTASLGSFHDRAHAGRIGHWITVNGDGEAVEPVRRHERLRLRLCNTANARIFELGLKGLTGWTIALDGQPVPPEPIQRLTLGPAQRADLIVDVTAAEGEEAALAVIERDSAFAAVLFPISGQVRNEPLPVPTPLAANPVQLPADMADAARQILVMEGGAMGRMMGAKLEGQSLGPRDLAQRGMAWAMNGVAGMPDAPLVDVTRGRAVHLAIHNDTAWPHAMHIHGHHFQRVNKGQAHGPLRDTVLMQRGETAEVAFVADNPGDWLVHCHMAEHADSGMMTWFRVR